MKNNTIKLNEQQLSGLIMKALKESFSPVGTVKDPFGYKCLRDEEYNAIIEHGFVAAYRESKPGENAGNYIAGPGFYFSLKEPDERMLSRYGRNIIKVKVLGDYPVYKGIFEQFFVVPFSKAHNIIPVLANGKSMIRIQDEKNNVYGNQWTSTSTINEQQLRKVIAESIRMVLNEGYATPATSDCGDYATIECEDKEPFRSIRDGLNLIIGGVNYVLQYSPHNRFGNKILKLCYKIEEVNDFWKRAELQKTGINADKDFNSQFRNL